VPRGKRVFPDKYHPESWVSPWGTRIIRSDYVQTQAVESFMDVVDGRLLSLQA
jgi:hypothetical protein